VAKLTNTQSFNADEKTIQILSSVKKYRIKKDIFIREAISAYFNSTIEPFQRSVTKKGKYKDVPF
jgi:hypothetical protein